MSVMRKFIELTYTDHIKQLKDIKEMRISVIADVY